ncbi:hypothetical protein DR999_PMT00753 [Platysternon megacephalum]|uniref:Uncharacterized protein n=1 Tax=Platysternon megacephalum TaxID=55544 RepID=A0A4D9EVP8_9SAUR|nr:hypothetical protein DR999_PMT00753 [Platysternon megacephalum]
MYQNVNDLLLLNLVKEVTSPERVVRAARSGVGEAAAAAGFGDPVLGLLLARVCETRRETAKTSEQERVSSPCRAGKAGRAGCDLVNGKEEKHHNKRLLHLNL